MPTPTSKWLALLAVAALSVNAAFAQDNKALLDALVAKGILTNDEAAKIAAEVKSAPAPATPVFAAPASKIVKKLTLSGRFQAQFAGFGASIDGAANPAYTNHFLLRRMYIGAKADLTNNFSGVFNYDFANASFDAAFVEYKQSDALIVDVGLRKAPIGLEEWAISSGALKAIERSPITRYFVESNNGRRLGAGSYRVGAYVGGTQGLFSYNLAVTNPERDEFSSLGGNSDPGVQNSGSASTNTLAYWANAGLGDKFNGGTWKVGASLGYLPDQGGTTIGKGDNLTVYSTYGVVTFGKAEIAGEYFWSDNQHGVSATRDAHSSGFWIQPSVMVMPKLEAVLRYSFVDSDHRGVNLSDGIRSAPSGGTMNKMEEWYVGGNYYFAGNDAKFQLGYIHGESKDKITGGAAKASTDGVRSQVQLQF